MMQSHALAYRPYEQVALEDRCTERHAIKVASKLRVPGGHPFAVTVTDVSIAGFRAEAVCNSRAGSICWLTLPGLESQQAEVIWNDGVQIGCAFSKMISPLVLETMKRRWG
jgi:hypothetical protein